MRDHESLTLGSAATRALREAPPDGLEARCHVLRPPSPPPAVLRNAAPRQDTKTRWRGTRKDTENSIASPVNGSINEPQRFAPPIRTAKPR